MMTPERKTEIEERWQECERQIQAIHAGKVLDGDPAEMEGTLLEEQDAIEFGWGRRISASATNHYVVSRHWVRRINGQPSLFLHSFLAGGGGGGSGGRNVIAGALLPWPA